MLGGGLTKPSALSGLVHHDQLALGVGGFLEHDDGPRGHVLSAGMCSSWRWS